MKTDICPPLMSVVAAVLEVLSQLIIGWPVPLPAGNHTVLYNLSLSVQGELWGLLEWGVLWLIRGEYSLVV
jgi:hypothetical protein